MTNRKAPTHNKNPATNLKEKAKPISHFSHSQLRKIFEGGDVGDPLPEMIRIFKELSPESNPDYITKIYEDLTGIFSGDFEGFRESSTRYHDLRHTRNVALATIRLFHALHCESVHLPPDIIKLGLICAYFHDTGMLLTVKDSKPSGAAYLKSHEERSISFLRDYMHKRGFPGAYFDNCESIINCTNLTVEPDTINFESEEIKIAGHILGTADILAQMADRYYLESLPLLYMEQQDAGILQHPSSLALMRQTTMFYHKVIENRLKKSFTNKCISMRTHFQEWWQLDCNLYMEYITKNIRYLEEVVRKHDSGEGELGQYLRRQQPKV